MLDKATLCLYLFLLTVETLAMAVREDVDIKGIVIEPEETKLPQYADDITAVLLDVDSAYELCKLLEIFRQVSGFKLKNSKTEGLWTGSLKDNGLTPLRD